MCLQTGPGRQYPHVGWQSQKESVSVHMNKISLEALDEHPSYLEVPVSQAPHMTTRHTGHPKWKSLAIRGSPFPIQLPKIQDKWCHTDSPEKKKKNKQPHLRENSCTEFRGSQPMPITSSFWSTLSLVFMIHLLQHSLKDSLQPCFRINHGNYQEQKSFPQ